MHDHAARPARVRTLDWNPREMSPSAASAVHGVVAGRHGVGCKTLFTPRDRGSIIGTTDGALSRDLVAASRCLRAGPGEIGRVLGVSKPRFQVSPLSLVGSGSIDGCFLPSLISLLSCARLLVGGWRSDFDKDVELLVLRHQLVVLGRRTRTSPLVRERRGNTSAVA